ncbi:MAG: 1-deoxy-D-xylulose-5-phosphate reductoisomerase [Clostridiales bacterium]|nr:1-deoxy-D-xylulose-5-phosphate reductoisomerase [Clostridiales bacterium]
MHKIAVLGSTGSIGTQALAAAALHPDEIQVTALTAHRNAELLFEQVRAFRPSVAALTDGEREIPEDLQFCQWFFGADALEQAALACEAESVLVSVTGMVGLRAVLAARRAGKRVLLANKEALVAGGQLVMEACRDENGQKTLLPVDSEHSAIFQCLHAAQGNPAEEILLTASGGPFRTWEKEKISAATVAQALGHPTWRMGRKITVDSASMFNKGLEIIEAKWLFDMPQSRIRVLVHPQSIVHSAVRFRDGAVIAQMGTADMRLPILYAMTYPERMETGAAPLDLAAVGTLTFENADAEKFPALTLARQAIDAGGAACCVLNAANEVAVDAFLREKVTFGDIYTVVAETLSRVENRPVRQVEDVFEADGMARRTAGQLIEKLS